MLFILFCICPLFVGFNGYSLVGCFIFVVSQNLSQEAIRLNTHTYTDTDTYDWKSMHWCWYSKQNQNVKNANNFNPFGDLGKRVWTRGVDVLVISFLVSLFLFVLLCCSYYFVFVPRLWIWLHIHIHIYIHSATEYLILWCRWFFDVGFRLLKFYCKKTTPCLWDDSLLSSNAHTHTHTRAYTCCFKYTCTYTYKNTNKIK